MTLLIEESDKTFIGAGTVGPFTWAFRFFENSDIEAKRIADDGTETPLSETVDYVLTGAGTYDGGSLTLTSELEVGERLYVERNTPALQKVDLRNQGDFFPETYEEALDKIVAIQQNLLRIASFSLKFLSPAVEEDTYLPKLIADHMLVINAEATSFELTPNRSADVNVLQTDVNAVEDRATALEGDLVAETEARQVVDNTLLSLITDPMDGPLVSASIRDVSVSGQVLTSDRIVIINASAGNVVLTLLSAADHEARNVLVQRARDDVSSNTVTIDPVGIETIGKGPAITLVKGEGYELIPDGVSDYLQF